MQLIFATERCASDCVLPCAAAIVLLPILPSPQVDNSNSIQAQLAGNVTISLLSIFIPGPGQNIFSVARWLLFIAPRDLCDVTSSGNSACFNTDITSVMQIITIVFGEGAPPANPSREEQMQAVEKLQAEHDKVQSIMQQQPQQKAASVIKPKRMASL